jgi:hypothetical protein
VGVKLHLLARGATYNLLTREAVAKAARPA